MNQESSSLRKPGQFRKLGQFQKLGLISATGIVISSMVGAGLFTTSGFALADLGSPSIVLLAWVVAGLIALCGAIGYGELARLFQESGGEYLFLSRTIHPAIGFLAGCVSLLAGFTGAIAFAATALESYSGLVGKDSVLPTGSIAMIAVLLATMLHLFHVNRGAHIQNFMVLGKFVLLFLFLVVAMGNYPSHWPGLSQQTTSTTHVFSLTTFCMSLVWISLSYCGFNASIYIASEVKDAKKNVPRAMLFGTLLVGLFYIALNAVFVFAPDPEQITGQEQVAVIAARTVGGVWLAELVRWTVIISLFTSVSVMIMTGPRVYAKMADDGLLPRWLRFQKKTPQSAIIMQAVLAIVVIYISTLKQLLSYLGFTLSLSSALTVASLFWIKPRAGQPIWIRIAAFVYVASTLFIATLAASKSPWESGYGLLTILAGLLLYAVIRNRR